MKKLKLSPKAESWRRHRGKEKENMRRGEKSNAGKSQVGKTFFRSQEGNNLARVGGKKKRGETK